MISIRFTLFEECPHCHNHYLCLPLIRQNVSHAQKYHLLIANNQKQFTILFAYMYRCFLAFALLHVTRRGKTVICVGVLFSFLFLKRQ